MKSKYTRSMLVISTLNPSMIWFNILMNSPAGTLWVAFSAEKSSAKAASIQRITFSKLPSEPCREIILNNNGFQF